MPSDEPPRENWSERGGSPPGNPKTGSGGSMVARLKLKGIDGRTPPGVEPAA